MNKKAPDDPNPAPFDYPVCANVQTFSDVGGTERRYFEKIGPFFRPCGTERRYCAKTVRLTDQNPEIRSLGSVTILNTPKIRK